MSWPELRARIRPRRGTIALSGALALLGAAGGLVQPLAAREVIAEETKDPSRAFPRALFTGIAIAGVPRCSRWWRSARSESPPSCSRSSR